LKNGFGGVNPMPENGELSKYWFFFCPLKGLFRMLVTHLILDLYKDVEYQ
jgi:hypothetical protein